MILCLKSSYILTSKKWIVNGVEAAVEREALESRRGPVGCERGLKYFGFGTKHEAEPSEKYL